jgi:O-antigen ligase/tetratricopeptide (TPR) repeat protein
MKSKFIIGLFCFLVIVTLLTPFWIFRDLLFPYITSKAYFLRILVEISLPFYAYLLLTNKEYRPSLKNPLSIAVMAFLLINIVSAIVGVNPLRSFWGNFERMGGVFYLAHLTLLYFYVLLLGQMGQEYMRTFVVSLIGTGALVSIYGILVKLSGNHFLLNDPSYPRISATFGNPIFFASFLIIPMFLTLYYLVGEGARWKQFLYGIIVLIELYCILLSETRGAVVGLAVALFIAALLYVVFNSKRKLQIWGGGVLAVFIVAVGLAFSLHNQFPQGSMFHRVFNLKDSNTEARLIQWGVALKGYKDRPLLGVGAENYYFISNKYYNPAIYQYDPSWFDKPHNYLIEVLVTSGIFGFAAYAAIVISFIWILWRAYRQDLLSLLEFCLLLAGFLTYQIQNLFVFDTISASLTFFVFLGFAGFLWHVLGVSDKQQTLNSKQKVSKGLDGSFVAVAVGLISVVMIYVLYEGNITGMEIAKAINYGYAYATVNPQMSADFFARAQSLPFVFDPIQMASKYGDVATNWAIDPQSLTPEYVNKNLDNAIAAQQDAVARVPNDPTGWQQLANLYLTKAILNKTALDPRAKEAAQTAMDLAPKRPEPELMMARLDISQNDIPGAMAILQNIIADIPRETPAKLQLGHLYAYKGDYAKATEIGESVLASGYKPAQASDIDWIGQAYEKESNYAQAARIYEMAVAVEPNNLQDYWSLAQMDAKIGKNDEARKIAEALIQADAKDTKQFQDFINSLK